MNHDLKYVLLLIVMLLAPASLAPGQSNVEIFDAQAEAARKEWNVPGMSVAVVQDGKVVLSKGYGIRELGKNDAVDAQTLFGSMSTTKAMVAVAKIIGNLL